MTKLEAERLRSLIGNVIRYEVLVNYYAIHDPEKVLENELHLVSARQEMHRHIDRHTERNRRSPSKVRGSAFALPKSFR